MPAGVPNSGCPCVLCFHQEQVARLPSVFLEWDRAWRTAKGTAAMTAGLSDTCFLPRMRTVCST